MAGRLVRDLIRDTPSFKFYDSKMTGEKFDEVMHLQTMEHGCAHTAIAISELAVFLGTERYMANMPTLLTDLYDCPAERDGAGTLLRGTVNQRNVFLSFLTASTPIWLVKTVNPNVIEGGFTSRCLFVISDVPKRSIAWPDIIENEAEDRGTLLANLRAMRVEATQYKDITLSGPAMDNFVHWYSNRQHSVDAFRSTFEAREDTHILRVAAFLAINDHSWVIQCSHLSIATEFVKQLKEAAGNIFESGDRGRFTLGIDLIRTALINSGSDPIARNVLYSKVRSRLGHAEFMVLLDVLHEMQAIQRFAYKRPEGGPTTDFIRGTRLLLTRGFTESVAERF
jgi:hypothetical protein